MRFLVSWMVLFISSMALPAVAGEGKTALDYALVAAELEVRSGALEMALDEGAETALFGSIDVLEHDLGRPLTTEETATVTGIFRKVLEDILTEEIWMETTAAVYARHLSVEELGDLVAFYRSESGRKVLSVQAELGRDLGEAADRLLGEGQERFADEVDSALAKALPELGTGTVE